MDAVPETPAPWTLSSALVGGLVAVAVARARGNDHPLPEVHAFPAALVGFFAAGLAWYLLPLL